jgi:hypothetical protein
MLLIFAIIFSFSGCRPPETTQTTRDQQQNLQRADRGEALIDAVADQLADLASGVDTELRTPTKILDSTKTSNGADMMAVAIADPQNPAGTINVIGVAFGNAQFKDRGVRSGDILKYYILEDETLDPERKDAGFDRKLAREFTIGQVIDNNTLIIEGGLSKPIVDPAKVEVWRNFDDRLEEINRHLLDYTRKQQPPLNWEPGPDNQVIVQVIAWLNQWLQQVEPKSDWKRDPLIDSLDKELLENKTLEDMLSLKSLAAQTFDAGDGHLVQEAVWLRDISRWAQGDDFNDLQRATELFDWTIRNVQLVADDDARPHRPWRTLAEGRGTANERAWVFALLCRQQSLDVVMLKISSIDSKGQSADNPPSALRPPPVDLPALLLDGQLYLFDTRLGLPIPGPGGAGVATLAQVQQDDAVLRQLDLENAPYRLNSDSFKNVTAAVVASPFELSRRARQLESKLTGDRHLMLSVAPSQIAERLKSIPTLAGVELWDVPFRTLRDQLSLDETQRTLEALAFEPLAKRPYLWKARMLHFQGRRQHDAKAKDEGIDDHRDSAKLYMHPSVRPTDEKIASISSADQRRVDTIAKQAATLWIGNLLFDEKKFDVAESWLRRAAAGSESSPWASSTRYNLARSLVSQNKFDEAVKLLE